MAISDFQVSVYSLAKQSIYFFNSINHNQQLLYLFAFLYLSLPLEGHLCEGKDLDFLSQKLAFSECFNILGREK